MDNAKAFDMQVTTPPGCDGRCMQSEVMARLQHRLEVARERAVRNERSTGGYARAYCLLLCLLLQHAAKQAFDEATHRVRSGMSVQSLLTSSSRNIMFM